MLSYLDKDMATEVERLEAEVEEFVATAKVENDELIKLLDKFVTRYNAIEDENGKLKALVQTLMSRVWGDALTKARNMLERNNIDV